jgi:carboxylesterase type B
MVQGVEASGIAVYKGIPLGIPVAAPPLGNLRWRAPETAPPWNSVRNADKFAPACIQIPIVNAELGMDAVTTNEDAFTLTSGLLRNQLRTSSR